MIRRDVLKVVWLFVSACGQRVAGVGPRAAECTSQGKLLARDGNCVAKTANQADGTAPVPNDQNPTTAAPGSVTPNDGPGSILTAPDEGGVQSQELKGLKVAIDVGHGLDDQGFDPGATSRGLEEYTLNAKEAAQVALLLRAKGATVSVFDYTRDGRNPKLDLRARGGRAAGHNVFVSIHHNSAHPAAQGTEVLYHPEGTAKDRRLANCIQEKMVQHIWNGDKSKDRKAKVQPLGILSGVPESVDSCCLTEAFFISASNVTTTAAEDWVGKAALAMADGISQYWKTRGGALSLVEEFVNDGPFPISPDPEGLYKDH